MFISPTPTIVAGIIGAIIGWLVADRNCHKSQQEESPGAGKEKKS